MEENDSIISLVHVSKVFDKTFTAVNDFSLDIKRGEFVTLLGPSGCGKTTTLRMIAGFDIPSSGKILLSGQDITNLPPYQRPVNTVFQHYALFPNLDVYDNIAFGLKLKRIPYKDKNGKIKMKKLDAKTIDEKVAKALEIVDMEEMEDRDISNLSGGQQQRVAIARAIVNEPQVLLLDEPLSALDHKMRLDMQIELKEMHKKLGITFIYVTHDQEEALSMSDKIVVMKDGEIAQVGTPETIYNEPSSAYVADFIGESNIYNGTMLRDKKVRFLGGVWDSIDDFKENEKVDVVIRPEDVELGPINKGIVNGTINSRVFKGEDYSYVILVGKSEVLCRDKKKHDVGDKVSISVDKENLQIVQKGVTDNEWDDAIINTNNEIETGDVVLKANVTQLIKGSSLDEKGNLYDPKSGHHYDFTDAQVVASCGLDDPTISDNLEGGLAKGTVISAVWHGDHYLYLIRTEGETDFLVNSPYQWNVGDTVSIDIDPSKIRLRLKKDLNSYVID